uniref:FCH domain only protein 2 n=1 Tax=Syphacia muris TaxID=451379 RepID=A0A158R608_9BILA
MVAVDYVENFWGEKHHGYQTLYENLKRGEDAVQELAQFLKERANFEEECSKYFTRAVNKTTTLGGSVGAFAETWNITKETFENLAEIQSALFVKLQQLLKDVVRYHEDLVRSRKRVKEQDVIDAVNLMQTTTTCLQKSKETYVQRCSELEKLRKENALAKETAKAENKVLKSRDEYKSYVEKYERVRAEFEEKMVKATRAFQAHDHAFLQQMKNFFISFALSLEDATTASLKVYAKYRGAVDEIDINNIMLKFIEMKGTGKDRPETALFEEIDCLGDTAATGSASAPSSSNSSAIFHGITQCEGQPQTAHDLLALDSGTFESISGEKNDQPSSAPSADNNVAETNSSTSSSIFSASLGRQKLSMWLPSKRKKHASQGSLPTGEASSHLDHAQFEPAGTNKAKKSLVDLTSAAVDNGIEDSRSTASSSKSEEKSCLGTNDSVNALDLPLNAPPPLPTNPPPDESNEDEFAIRDHRLASSEHSDCSSYSESSDDEEMSRAAKLRQINIKPLSESISNVTSMDELKLAAEHISMNATINRSNTFDRDPWTSTSQVTPFSLSLGGNVRPLRAAFTGEEYLRRKNDKNVSLPFSLSMGYGSSNSHTNNFASTTRARPRSNTPTFGASCMAVNLAFQNTNSNVTSNNIPSFLRSDSTNSLGTCSDFPFSASTSNLFSTLPHVPEYKLPVAMAVNEYVHAWFKGANGAQYSVRVFGTVLVSFHSSSVAALRDLNSNIQPLRFRLTSKIKMKTVLPNKQLISIPNSGSDSTLYSCVFDRTLLANWLSIQSKNKPDAPFYNVEVLRYELCDAEAPPLSLASYWKLDKDNTDIRIDYHLNQDSLVQNALLNLTFSTKVNGGVISVNADPKEEWSSANESLSWKLTELSRHGENAGSLKARLTLSSGPSVTSQTFVQFQTSDATMSGANITIENEDSYFLSLLRKKLLSGKYYCDPEVYNGV